MEYVHVRVCGCEGMCMSNNQTLAYRNGQAKASICSLLYPHCQHLLQGKGTVNMRYPQREQGHSQEVWGRGEEGEDGEEVTGDEWSLSPVWWWHMEERRRKGEGVLPPLPSQCWEDL